MGDVKFDIARLYQQVKDEAMLDLLRALAPNKDEADKAVAMLRVFTRHGVSVETAIKISKELAEELGFNMSDE